MNKEQELIQKKEDLQGEIRNIDSQLEHETAKKEIRRLIEITEQLNSLFQDAALEKHCQDECNELYDIMQAVDKKQQNLMQDNDIDESDLLY